ncbi:MAG: hypothetical protein SF182_08625, partial [Deltaproteobacteria bacterium]|nr:hypothetical protein [Deltaproteobacteria bacterium]
MAIARRLARQRTAAAALALGLSLAAAAAAQEARLHVIPAGQEALLADMLGRGAALPGQCRFVAGGVVSVAATARYDCATGAVEIELRHPDDAPAGAPRSARFALIVRQGEAPPALLEALGARLRAGEAGFVWIETAPPDPWWFLYDDRVQRAAVVSAALALAGLSAWWLRRGGRWRRLLAGLTTAVRAAVSRSST